MTDFYADPSAQVAADVLVRGTGQIFLSAYSEVQERVALDTGLGGTIWIGPRCKLKSGVMVRCYGGSLKIDARTSIGEYSVISCHGGVVIGKNCMFGPFVFLNAADHITDGPDPYRFQGETTKGVVVEDDVWLGARVTVLDGVRIGARAVVGAHSVVAADVPGGVLAVGAPARVVKEIQGRSE